MRTACYTKQNKRREEKRKEKKGVEIESKEAPRPEAAFCHLHLISYR